MFSNSEESALTKLLAKSQYKNIAATKKDVLEVLQNYRSLAYSRQKFVFHDGTKKDLINLQGTIPVVYKNNTYYIPICIWLAETHPHDAPMCFVQPTPNMLIKVSMYVDHNGKVYLPYLHQWQPQSSDLLGLIQVMIVAFGEQPPVYSKPKEQVTPYPMTSYMPQPSRINNSFLPYPASGAGAAFPSFPANSNFGSYPPYMPTPGGSQEPQSGSSSTGGYPPYMNFPPAAGYNSGYSSSNANQTGTITDEHIKASLVSAIEDKLRRRIQEKVNQWQAEIETLNRTKQELMEGSARIDSIIAGLQREKVDITKSISILRDKEQELEKSLEVLEQTDGIDADEAVTTTAPLYKQLLNAYAEEAATEDAIYYLGEALRSSVIDLEAFLKHVRQLSRKQFMLRIIMQKCRQKAGLAG